MLLLLMFMSDLYCTNNASGMVAMTYDHFDHSWPNSFVSDVRNRHTNQQTQAYTWD